jgi:hypothetical protein
MSLLYAALTGLPTVDADAARDAGLARLPRVERLLARARARPASADWRRWALAAAGLEAAPGDLPAGAWLAGRAAAPDAATCLVATPVTLRAGLRDVRLAALPAAAPARLAALALRFNADFGGTPATLEVADGTLLLRHAAPLAVETHDPEPLQGADIGAALPGGADGARLRRLMTELQMWLHDSPADDGINGLWLWGAGRVPLAGVARWPAALPDDPLLAAARRAHPGATDPSCRLLRLDVGARLAAGESLATLDEAWGRALALGPARVHLAGREFVLERRQRLRLWRRARPWWELIG